MVGYVDIEIWDDGCERSIRCHCEKKSGRDEVRLAHLIEDGIPVLNEIYGVKCDICGMNWRPFASLGGDWLHCGCRIEDICQSDAEIAFYKQIGSIVDLVFPQVFIPINDKTGYFLDFYIPRLHAGIEIDGKQHKHQQGYDIKRDAWLLSNKNIRVLRYCFRRTRLGDYRFSDK